MEVGFEWRTIGGRGQRGGGPAAATLGLIGITRKPFAYTKGVAVVAFKGDLPSDMEEVPMEQGESRWVRPGFAYGPEYNGQTASMEISVLGTEIPPAFEEPPVGPYKLQKQVQVTHVFDEL